MPPSPTPEAPTPSTGDNTTLMGILAYLGPLVIVPYLMAKDDDFVHFHIKQGIVLFAIEIVIYLVTGMMFYSLFVFQLLSLVNLGCLILSIVGIVNVVQKKEAPLPLVGHLAKHVPF